MERATAADVTFRAEPSCPSNLPAGEVHVWLFDPGLLNNADLRRAAESLLSAEERERSQRFVFDDDRYAYIAARAVARTALSVYSGTARAADISFVFNAYGKPSVGHPVLSRRLSFNLSHTRGLVACAAAWDIDLGIDVEAVRNAPLDLAERYFASPEVVVMRARSPEDQPDAFFAFWTLKESFIKARGMGLSIPLDSFAVSLHPPALLPYGEGAALRDEWRFVELTPAPAFKLALCMATGEGGGRVVHARWMAGSAIVDAGGR